MLGRELVRAAAAARLPHIAWSHEELDVTDERAVFSRIVSARPSAVVHAAAFTDVDACESASERAYLVNGRGTSVVAAACRELGCRLVYLSSDYVFSGEKGPYVETDVPGPVSAYGWSKLVGEEGAASLGDKGVIARTAWLYADHGKNFFLTMLRLARERSELEVVTDQLGCPTFAGDLARVLLDLAASSASGIFHVVSRGSASWNDFAKAIVEGRGLNVPVRGIASFELPRAARRPRNSVLLDTRLEKEGIAPMPEWEDGLARCLARMSAARA
jgi:dTDP-4-dehydrorhamnose reductase